MTLPAPHDLPGTDPRFHEPRKYLSPVMHHGEKILASFGSCKEDNCGYRGAWVTRAARDRNMWMHRALKVREARIIYFTKLFPNPLDPRPGQLFLETADHNTHFFAPWQNQVKLFYRDLTGDDRIDLPEYDFYREYQDGKFAMDTARFIFEANLR